MERMELSDKLELALIKANKVEFFLSNLLSKYSTTQPDPIKALQWAKNPEQATTEQRLSFDWFYEHDSIIEFIDTAHDYTMNLKSELNEILGAQ